MLEEYSDDNFIIDSSIHTEYMKGELLSNNNPLNKDSADRNTMLRKVAQIESTSNSLYDNIHLVEQEFGGYII